jgi:hypothetical protein
MRRSLPTTTTATNLRENINIILIPLNNDLKEEGLRRRRRRRRGY